MGVGIFSRGLGAGRLSPTGPPVINSVTPSLSFRSLSGSNLVIDGYSFINRPGLAVSVGGVPCTGVTWINENTIHCVTGALTDGLKDIVVTNADTQSDTLFGAYRVLGAALWLDPSDTTTLTAPGNILSQINDKSGNNRHFLQASIGNRPTVSSSSLNGLTSLHFLSTSSQYLEGPTLSSLSAAEGFIANKMTAGEASQQHAIWHFSSAADSGYFTIFGAIYDSFGSTVRSSGAFPTPNETILESTNLFSAISASNDRSFTVNGTVLLSSVTNTVGWATTSRIGRNGTFDISYYDGNIGEVIIFPRKLSTPERSIVQSYYHSKWNSP